MVIPEEWLTKQLQASVVQFLDRDEPENLKQVTA
jgi:hypothetical protein